MSSQRLFRILALAVLLLAYDCHYDVPFNAPVNLFLSGFNPNGDGSDKRVYFEPVTPPVHGDVVFTDLNSVICMPHKGYSGPDTASPSA